MLNTSVGVISVTWIFDKAHFHLGDYVNKQNDFEPHRVQGLPLPTHHIQSYYMVCNLEHWNTESLVHRWYNHFCLCQYAECWMCSSPDGIWHASEFSQVSSRWCQTSHQQCCIALSSWHFQGESCAKQVSYTVWERIFMPTNLAGLKPMWLFSVGVLEG
jgi:hypothetical protein